MGEVIRPAEFEKKAPREFSRDIFQRDIDTGDRGRGAAILHFPGHLIMHELALSEERLTRVNTAIMAILANNEFDSEKADTPFDEWDESSQLKYWEIRDSRIAAVSKLLTPDELSEAYEQVKEIETSNQSETAKEGEYLWQKTK
jgi:hypothetical protein